MTQWIETKLRYDKVMENGAVKKVTEAYLVDALSFTEAEARITEEITPYISGEFEVKAVKKEKINEVIGDKDSGRYYLAKVGYITIDEKSGSEKTAESHLLVGEEDFQTAYGTLLDELRKSVSDWKIISLAETAILDVFPVKLSNGK